MSVLVIGGTGFIGRSIIKQLIEQDVAFTVLTRSPAKLDLIAPKIPFIIGDLLDATRLDLSPYQQFINCAGEVHNEALMQQLHVDAITGLLHKIKFIDKAHWLQISSVGVYGAVRSGVVHEDHPFAPIGHYEQTKAAGELLLKQFCLDNKIDYTIIRPSNVFGGDMSNQSLFQLISMMKRKLFFYIGTRPDEIMMNYIPAEDVAALVLCCLNNKAAINQDFIISDQVSLSEFVHIASKELGIKNSFYHLPEALIRFLAGIAHFLPGFPLTPARIDALTTQAIYSSAKATFNLGFSPPVGLERGLAYYIASLYDR